MHFFPPTGLLHLRADGQAEPMLLRWDWQAKKKKNASSGVVGGKGT